jgi:Domain of unknown function (DUF4277)
LRHHTSLDKSTQAGFVANIVLNGLGFVNQQLYLASRFFQNKPNHQLITSGIEAKHLHDDMLGRAAAQPANRHVITTMEIVFCMSKFSKFLRPPFPASSCGYLFLWAIDRLDNRRQTARMSSHMG